MHRAGPPAAPGNPVRGTDRDPYEPRGSFRGKPVDSPGKSAGPPEPVSDEEKARQVCLELLSRTPRTRTQLATALRKRGVPDEVAAAVLGRFAEVGLIDDAVFARAWVESRHHSRGLAKSMLAAELEQRGVEPADVQAAVGTLAPDEEVETAQQLVAKRVAATRRRPLPNRVRQLVGLLARKGYPASLAYRIVREELEADLPHSETPRVDRLRLEALDLAAAEDDTC